MKVLEKIRPDINKVLLVILDGVGYSEHTIEQGNAIAAANIPVIKNLWQNYPTIKIKAHGTYVGMPSNDDMGNSEVGHNVLGCGRVFDQGAKLVANSIHTKEIYKGFGWREIIENCLNFNSHLHFIGLLSDGNVHSNINHLLEMIRQAKIEKIKNVRIHILLDGRDVPETSALVYVEKLESFIKEINSNNFNVQIASGGGRMAITMDRYEADWSMVARGWKLHVHGEGRMFTSANEAIKTYRAENANLTDQYIPGFVISDQNGAVGKIKNHDSVIFFNFRGDRAIEISRAFTDESLTEFNREPKPEVVFAGMMQYDGDLKIPPRYLVVPPAIDRTMAEYLAISHIKQYAISETQKYGHVTYFWNGNRSDFFDKNYETYEEISSDIIPFDQTPAMKSAKITDKLLKAIKSEEYFFLRVNYPNGDMVGHTGNFKATVEAIESLDQCISEIISAAKETDTVVLLTADHGNADEMYEIDKNGNVQLSNNGEPKKKTSHTLNPVLLSLYDPKNRWELKDLNGEAGLANIVATILEIMGFKAPEDYYSSLLVEK